MSLFTSTEKFYCFHKEEKIIYLIKRLPRSVLTDIKLEYAFISGKKSARLLEP